MLFIYFSFLLCIVLCQGSDDISLNEIQSKDLFDLLPDLDITNSSKFLNKVPEDEEDDGNYSISWDTFMDTLTSESIKALNKVKNSIKTSYKLDSEIPQIEAAFNETYIEYDVLLETNLKKLFLKQGVNTTTDFMFLVLDLSNYLINQLIDFSLRKIGGTLLLPTKWYKQSMTQKVLRQQHKIASNLVECNLCLKLTLCRDRNDYTQFLTEWLRLFLGLSTEKFITLFREVHHILEENKHALKYTTKLQKTVQFIASGNNIIQRDTIDYLDEILNNDKCTSNLVPGGLKKGAILLADMFKLIDDNYELNEDNEDQLDEITKMIVDWLEDKSSSIKPSLDKIRENMQINMKIWPLDIQYKIDILWSQIILH